MILRFLLAATATFSLLVSPQLRFPARVSGGGGGGAGDFTSSDITALGTFRAPSGTSTTYAHGDNAGGGLGITGRVVSGNQQIIVRGNVPGSGGPLYIMQPPGSLSTFANHDSATQATAVATVAATWDDNCKETWSSGGVLDDDPIANLSLQGLYYDEATDLLHFFYNGWYQSPPLEDWNHCATQFSGNTPGTVYGPWRTKMAYGNGSTYRYGSEAAVMMNSNPFGNGKLVSTTIVKNNTNSPFGPTLALIDPIPTTATAAGFGNPDITTDATYLHYPIPAFNDGASASFTSQRRTFQIPHFEMPEGHITADPAQNSGASSWQQLDQNQGFACIDNTQKSGCIFLVRLTGKTGENTPSGLGPTTAHTLYCNPGGDTGNGMNGIDDHGANGVDCTDSGTWVTNTGPAATLVGVFAGFQFYSWTDLQDSTLNGGATAPHTILPLETVDLETFTGTRMLEWASDSQGVGGIYVNPTTRRMYINFGFKSKDMQFAVFEYAAASRPLPIDSDTPLDRILRAVGLKGDWKTTWTKATLHFDVNRSPLPWAAGLLVLLTPYGRLGRRRTS